jgi:hypothetical protein
MATAEQQALDFNPELQDVSRQRKLAELLMAQGMQQPQGQMISGYYVAPSWSQQLAPLANIVAGQAVGERADTKQQELATALRGKKLEVQQAIQQKIDTGDLNGALAIATQNSEYGGKDFIAPLMANRIPKAQEPKVVGNRLVDPTGKVLYTAPKEYAPHAVQMIDTPQGLVQFDPNNRSVTPVMMNGQQMMGTKGNLPEGATKQVTGATNLKDAIDNYKTTLKEFSTLDMANPNARASMGNAYNNMMLQAKEAYNLGVLNGPDYAILQSVVKDPTKLSSVLVSKKALEQQASDLSKQADTIIGNVYKTHNRPVPSNLQPKQPASNVNQTQQFDPKLLQYMTPEQQALFNPQGK